MSGAYQDALALIELDSIARGYRTLDALVKKSPVDVLEANLIEPGRYLILINGGVAEVEEAHTEALEIGADCVVDQLILPFVHQSILPALGGALDTDDPDTIGVVEATAVASTLDACDKALKNAEVALAGLRITPGLGGKAYFVVHGIQHDVEAALEISSEILTTRGTLLRVERIPRPHPDFLVHLLNPAPFSLGRRLNC